MGTYSSGNGYLLEVSGLCQRIIAEDTPRLGERHLSLKAMHEDRPRWIALTRRHRCTVHRRSHSCHIGTVASIDEAASCCRHRYLPACHASQSHAAQQQNATEHKRAHRRERRRRRRRGGRRQRICRIHRADKLACDLNDVHRLRRRAHRAVITGCRTPPASRNGYSHTGTHSQARPMPAGATPPASRNGRPRRTPDRGLRRAATTDPHTCALMHPP